ncbi:hypothetical protein ASM33_07020 [Wolbachia endosymbiont of Folsomia candida]|nr:hypothetical protein ASM33_07020 [Wolbachia endosymbiont of Folsomia candida]
MRKPATLIQKTQIEKTRENKITITVVSLFSVAIVSAIVLGIVFPITIPYSLDILRWSALFLLVAITWLDVSSAIDIEQQHRHQHSL